MKRIQLPPMRETAMGEFMSQGPSPASELRPPPPYKQEAVMEMPGEATVALQCPECGKTFATAQGLGAHRSRSHGYRSEHPKKPRKSDAPAAAPAEPASNGQPADPFEALTASLFPRGIPADREVLAGLLDLMTSYEKLLDIVTR